MAVSEALSLNITRAVCEIYCNVGLDTVPLTSHSNSIIVDKFGVSKNSTILLYMKL